MPKFIIGGATMENRFTQEQLKAQAQEVWKLYLAFRERVYVLGDIAEFEALENASDMDLCDSFVEFGEDLSIALEKVFGIECKYDDEE
jgi:hypothetical protein